eukprot:TRINITY_DN113533_c0_g1_i1.p1 TRINITY_DN113533_c0_g1~~TRINITY_DN113533_c0_g1_i1.p1  ORF type:complete len:311 (+),score=85.03 TRINITY_DN113533_c0_g1_i1:63-995(+)
MEPVQIARWHEGALQLCDEALEKLAALPYAIDGVVAVVGPAGDGKSTLCNCLLAALQGGCYTASFACGESLLEGVTRGVWLGAARLSDTAERCVVLLDAEGLDMGNAEAELSLSLFASCLASNVLYNVRGPRLRRSALDGLRVLTVASAMAKGFAADAPLVSLVVRDASDAASSLGGLDGVHTIRSLPPPEASADSDSFGCNAHFLEACRTLAQQAQLASRPKLVAGEAVNGKGLAGLLVAAAMGSSGLGSSERALLAANCSEEELEKAYAKASSGAAAAALERDQLVDNAAAAAEVAALPDDGSSSEDD